MNDYKTCFPENCFHEIGTTLNFKAILPGNDLNYKPEWMSENCHLGNTNETGFFMNTHLSKTFLNELSRAIQNTPFLNTNNIIQIDFSDNNIGKGAMEDVLDMFVDFLLEMFQKFNKLNKVDFSNNEFTLFQILRFYRQLSQLEEDETKRTQKQQMKKGYFKPLPRFITFNFSSDRFPDANIGKQLINYNTLAGESRQLKYKLSDNFPDITFGDFIRFQFQFDSDKTLNDRMRGMTSLTK